MKDDDGEILTLMTWKENGGHISIRKGSMAMCDWFVNVSVYGILYKYHANLSGKNIHNQLILS